MKTHRYGSNGVIMVDGPLDDEDIATFLTSKIDAALNQPGSSEDNTRAEMYDRYVGAPIGDESDGGSTFRTREVMEMVEDALPPLLSVFLSADSPVLFEPSKQADVEGAKQETDVVNYYLFQRAEAFLPLHSLFKSTLLDPVAYCKVHCIHQEEHVHHDYEELTPPQFNDLMSPDRTWAKKTLIQPKPGRPPFELSYRFLGTEIVTRPRFLVESIPGHEVLVDEGARFLDLDEVWRDFGFICHATQLTYTELVQRGYDRSRLDDLPTFSDVGDRGGYPNRTTYNRGFRQHANNYKAMRPPVSDQSTRRFDVHECYVKMDVEGTGLAESWRVVLVAGEVFEKEKVSYQPFVAVSAIPMPHAHVGLSTAESMADLQALKTKLIRTLLNDAYRNEARRSYINKSAKTPDTDDQLKDPLTAYVDVKGDPRAAIMPEPQFSIMEETMGVLRYTDDMLKRRTGMAPDNALNPDVLRDATAHGMLASMDKQSNRLMGIARVIAETGVKKIGLKLHQLLRMYQDRQTVLHLRGKWVDVRPSDWHERTDMKVAVGLGFNSKEQSVMALTQLLAMQKEALGQGMAKPEHIKNTLEKIIESTNLGFYGQFFVDPTQPGWQPPPPPPNPQMEAVKAQAMAVQLQEQNKAKEIESKGREAMARVEVERLKAEIDRERISADAHLKKIQAQMEATLLPEHKLAEVRKLQMETAKLRAEIAKLGADVDKMDAETEALTRQESPDSEDASGGEDGDQASE